MYTIISLLAGLLLLSWG